MKLKTHIAASAIAFLTAALLLLQTPLGVAAQYRAEAHPASQLVAESVPLPEEDNPETEAPAPDEEEPPMEPEEDNDAEDGENEQETDTGIPLPEDPTPDPEPDEETAATPDAEPEEQAPEDSPAKAAAGPSLIAPASTLVGTAVINELFPDELFAASIAAQLGKAVTDTVTQNELNTIERINLNGALHSIEGAQYLNGLIEMRIANCQLTERFPEAFLTDIYPNINFYANGQRYQVPAFTLYDPSLAQIEAHIPPLLFQVVENAGGAQVGQWIVKDGNNAVLYDIPAYDGTELFGLNLPEEGTYNIELLFGNNSWMDLEQSQYFFTITFINNATATITGTVTDQNNDPIPGVTIQLLDSDNNVIATTTTNANGTYSFADLDAGSYTVTAAIPGYTSQSKGTSVQSGGTSVVNFQLLPEVGSMAGTVLDEVTGLPIQGATVQLYAFTQNNGLVLVGTTTTDENGEFLFTGLLAGTYRAIASADGYNPEPSQTLGVGGNQTTEVTIFLTRARVTLSGYVTDSQTGNPIPGATVTLPDGSTATTDDDGYYSATIYPGSYPSLTASATGHSSQSKPLEVQVNEDATLDFALDPLPGTLIVEVQYADANNTPLGPAEGASVELSDGHTGSTGSDGTVSFSLTPESYTATVTMPGYAAVLVSGSPAVVTPEGTVTLSYLLILQQGNLEGYVYEETFVGTPNYDAPIEGATVTVNGFTTTTDADGYYTFATAQQPFPLPVGRFTATASHENYGSQSHTVEIEPLLDTLQDFTLVPDPATLTINVIYADTDLPATGISVTVTGNNEAYLGVSDGNGQLVLQLDEGTYTAGAVAEGYTISYQPANGSAQLGPGGSGTITILLTPIPATLEGRVIDGETRLPLNGVTITITGPQPETRTTDTNGIDDGYYIVDEIAAGTYTVTASLTGYQSVTRSNVILQNGQTTDASFILVRARGTLSGTVTYANGNAAAGVTITVNGMTLTTDENGQYFAILEAGDYDVKASVTGYYDQTKENQTVTEGQNTIVDFVLQPQPASLTITVVKDTGDAMPGAELRIYSPSLGSITVYANENGQYVLEDLDAGRYNATAVDPDYTSDSKTILLAPGQKGAITLILGSLPGRLEGYVTYEGSGEPVPGVAIAVAPDGATVYTDENGYYSLVLTPGSYTATASDGYSTPQQEAVDINSNETTRQDFVLPDPRGTLEGLVYWRDSGAGIPEATVTVSDGMGRASYTLTTDANGEYALALLYPGSYTVTATVSGVGSQTTTVAVETGETVRADFPFDTPPPATSDPGTSNPATSAPTSTPTSTPTTGGTGSGSGSSSAPGESTGSGSASSGTSGSIARTGDSTGTAVWLVLALAATLTLLCVALLRHLARRKE